MAQEVGVVVSDLWRKKLANIYANETTYGPFSVPSYFKIGVGGWVDVGGEKEPVTPSATLTDITAGTGGYDDYYFQKALDPDDDLVYTAPNRLEIRCVVTTSEANDDGHGNSPEFFEIGIFDDDDRMLLYSTFPVEIKTVARSLQHIIYVDF